MDLQEINANLVEENANLKLEIGNLKMQLLLALLAKYARSSEKHKGDDNQGQLFDEFIYDEILVEENVEDVAEEEIAAVKEKKKTGRKPLPDYIPRVRIEYKLEESALTTVDGFKFVKIGEEISEELEFIPAQIRVLEHVRFKYACKEREEYGIKIATGCERVIPQGIASPSLLAHVLVQKYCYHAPMYRQEQQWQELGIDLNRNTLCNWSMKCAKLLVPVGEALKAEILNGNYLHADETPVTVLTHGEKENSRQGYMWIYASSLSKLSYFQYCDTRGGFNAAEFLQGFTGHVQADAYVGYDQVYKSGERKEVACWAHARRKFHDLIKIEKRHISGNHALKEIAKIYKVEADIREQEKKSGEEIPFNEVRLIRQKKSKPVLEAFKKWMDEIVDKTPPKGSLAIALNYALKNWAALTEYLEHGHLLIDNNFAENAIRPFALGRKNWLFMGNRRGAQAASLIYSILQSAKAHNLKPNEYMTHLLSNIKTAVANNTVASLLPNRVAKSNPHLLLKTAEQKM